MGGLSHLHRPLVGGSEAASEAPWTGVGRYLSQSKSRGGRCSNHSRSCSGVSWRKSGVSSRTSSDALLGVLARVGERLLGRHLVALVLEPRVGLGRRGGGRPARPARAPRRRTARRSSPARFRLAASAAGIGSAPRALELVGLRLGARRFSGLRELGLRLLRAEHLALLTLDLA